jgi:hypothetical protein
MSVQFNTYALWGVLLPYKGDLYDAAEPYRDDAFDQEVNPKDNVTVLFDGMDGNYIAVGHVLAKSPNHEGFSKPITLPRAPSVDRPEEMVAYGEWRKGIVNVLAALDIDLDAEGYDLGWHVITHYR